MHEYHKLKNAITEILVPLQYEESKSDTDTDYCGSIFCIYSLEEKRFMIEWDGEEGFGAIQKWIGNNSWSMLNTIVPEAAESDFNNSLVSLCEELKGHL